MPGRVSTRSTRPSTSTSTVSHKSSSQTLNSRPSTASHHFGPLVAIESEAPSSQLRVHVCRIFGAAQHTTASHRKHAVNLRQIHEQCCNGGIKSKGRGDLEGFDEERFTQEIERCVIRLMGIKKTEAIGDRVVRFLGTFLKHSSEKDLASTPGAESDVLPETPSTRLTSRILVLLLPLLSSKEKTVRYRTTQLISHIINSVDSIDDDLFQSLSSALQKRLRDKESMIRVQAVLGLGRLAGNEAESDLDEDDDEDGSSTGLLERLLKALQHDPSADVRRSLLLNLPISQTTLPYLLERARDQDAPTRRALFSRLLPALGDFRHLSLSMREKLLRWGLRDRDENVRKAATKLFRERWIEDCAGSQSSAEGGAVGGTAPPSLDALLEMLERIDVVNSGVEEGVALEAMKGFWEGRPDYCDVVNFEDAFWEALSAESAFVARTFNEFGRLHSDGRFEALVEEKMPEVTKLAFYLQKYTNRLIDSIRKAAGEGNDTESDDETVEQEFVVEQLLHIAQTLDYSDEMGRRKMFALMRETLAIPDLPEEATKLVVEVIRILCGNNAASEKEFCSVVLEAIAEVHDAIMGPNDNVIDNGMQEEDSFHSARSELSSEAGTPSQESFNKKTRAGKERSKEDDSMNEADEEARAIREIMINMKCLHIAQCMLENVEGQLQQNPLLVTMLNNLVVPAVRSHEAPLRERGLLCLGLCCLLDKTLAEENLILFLHCFNKGHDALQVYALHILCDILSTHGPSLLQSPALDPTQNGNGTSKPLFRILSKALKASDKIEVQSTACISLCKLMLSGVVIDEDLLRALVIAYFDPSTAGNLALRQALTYFLPVYCHSRRENQERMGRITVPALHSLTLLSESIDGDDEGDEEMVGLTVIAAHLVDWTDPRKLISLDSLGEAREINSRKTVAARPVNTDVHLNLARDVLEKMCSAGCNKEERKLLTSLLKNLHITSQVSSQETASTVHELATRAIDGKLVSDAPSRNALTKLVANLERVLGELESDADAAAATTAGGRKETQGTAASTVASAASSSSATSRRPSVAAQASGDIDMADVSEAKEEGDEDEGQETIVHPQAVKMDRAQDVMPETIEPVTGQESNSLLDELLEDDEEQEEEL